MEFPIWPRSLSGKSHLASDWAAIWEIPLRTKFSTNSFWGSRGAGSVSMPPMRSMDHLAPSLQTLYSASVPNRFSSIWRISKNPISHQNDPLCSYCKWEIPLNVTEWPYGKFHLESNFQQIRFRGFRGVGSVSMSLMRSIDHLAPFLQTLYSVSVPNRFSST